MIFSFKIFLTIYQSYRPRFKKLRAFQRYGKLLNEINIHEKWSKWKTSIMLISTTRWICKRPFSIRFFINQILSELELPLTKISKSKIGENNISVTCIDLYWWSNGQKKASYRSTSWWIKIGGNGKKIEEYNWLRRVLKYYLLYSSNHSF